MLSGMRASILLGLDLLLSIPATGRRRKPARARTTTPYALAKLAPGVFTLTWALTPGSPAIGNATFIVGERDVIVVDTGLSRSGGEAILAGLRQVTDKPVSMVVNTHWHGDHIFGNQVFRNGVSFGAICRAFGDARGHHRRRSAVSR